METKEILTNFKNVAVVGFSKDPTKPSHKVPMFLKEHGYHVIPVNPTVKEINGMKCYNNLEEIPDRVDVVEVFRPSKEVESIVEQAVRRAKEKGDVKVVWLQEGIVNENAKRQAEENGLIFVQDKCMYKEYTKYIEGN
ncbi:CoA-binding protein [Sulfuracidifex metallicus]|jgi:predicted CoA-binding protein|uniref:CoA-binding protein n=1 Tax=Sulfuracidifex metallicus DSM 6482 = JCM 9184 TaxID=523847 RepID=A0A6A9QKW3_SULME|nr:CoA-binding protein [Sulfuracidifex metallicus]MUN29907.1 CoA-binding protein [Sulfuracidifex metallicus DSM 6482 = JCM 9184]WOE51709.1 CoA-binding protein [Sulfuracidifex metallicus DSM 6482 = JCM 9184]